ncbi:MAG: hypothetical protein H0W88_11105 [Parachlamydiaceae bacterium]|nr:hypothetical protein [Parachlamydiaceae bacterium]
MQSYAFDNMSSPLSSSPVWFQQYPEESTSSMYLDLPFQGGAVGSPAASVFSEDSSSSAESLGSATPAYRYQERELNNLENSFTPIVPFSLDSIDNSLYGPGAGAASGAGPGASLSSVTDTSDKISSLTNGKITAGQKRDSVTARLIELLPRKENITDKDLLNVLNELKKKYPKMTFKNCRLKYEKLINTGYIVFDKNNNIFKTIIRAKWTPQEESILKKFIHLTPSQLVKKFPGRTLNSIEIKRRTLKKMNKLHPVSTTDTSDKISNLTNGKVTETRKKNKLTARFIELLPKKEDISDEDLLIILKELNVKYPSMTLKTCRLKFENLKKTGNIEFDKDNKKFKTIIKSKWTPEEESKLKQLMHLAISELEKEFPERTKNSIQLKRGKLKKMSNLDSVSLASRPVVAVASQIQSLASIPQDFSAASTYSFVPSIFDHPFNGLGDGSADPTSFSGGGAPSADALQFASSSFAYQQSALNNQQNFVFHTIDNRVYSPGVGTCAGAGSGVGAMVGAGSGAGSGSSSVTDTSKKISSLAKASIKAATKKDSLSKRIVELLPQKENISDEDLLIVLKELNQVHPEMNLESCRLKFNNMKRNGVIVFDKNKYIFQVINKKEWTNQELSTLKQFINLNPSQLAEKFPERNLNSIHMKQRKLKKIINQKRKAVALESSVSDSEKESSVPMKKKQKLHHTTPSGAQVPPSIDYGLKSMDENED